MRATTSEADLRSMTLLISSPMVSIRNVDGSLRANVYLVEGDERRFIAPSNWVTCMDAARMKLVFAWALDTHANSLPANDTRASADLVLLSKSSNARPRGAEVPTLSRSGSSSTRRAPRQRRRGDDADEFQEAILELVTDEG